MIEIPFVNEEGKILLLFLIPFCQHQIGSTYSEHWLKYA